MVLSDDGDFDSLANPYRQSKGESLWIYLVCVVVSDNFFNSHGPPSGRCPQAAPHAREHRLRGRNRGSPQGRRGAGKSRTVAPDRSTYSDNRTSLAGWTRSTPYPTCRARAPTLAGGSPQVSSCGQTAP